MSMNINGLGNTYNSINANSKQYKTLKEKGWLSGVIENESMMSPELFVILLMYRYKSEKRIDLQKRRQIILTYC